MTDKPGELRRGEVFLFFFWGIGTVTLSHFVIGAKLFLVYVYGWAKVWNDGLRLVDMPNGHPWRVSNGDVITDSLSIHWFISATCWFLTFMATYPLIRRLLPPAKKR
jgi:hypothetical protein